MEAMQHRVVVGSCVCVSVCWGGFRVVGGVELREETVAMVQGGAPCFFVPGCPFPLWDTTGGTFNR